MSFEEVVNTLNQLEDLTSALTHTFTYAKYRVFTHLDSEEFEYHCSLHYC